MSTTDHYLVLMALGPDRPGLVADVTTYLKSSGVNVEDSRMAVLGAEFAIVMLLSGSEKNIANVISGKADIEAKTGLSVTTKVTKSPEEHRRATVMPCLVTGEAIDREGIVHAVSSTLFSLGVNVVSMQTTAFNAPITGTDLFRLEARVEVPREVSIARLRQVLDTLAQNENIDLDVRTLVLAVLSRLLSAQCSSFCRRQ